MSDKKKNYMTFDGFFNDFSNAITRHDHEEIIALEDEQDSLTSQVDEQ